MRPFTVIVGHCPKCGAPIYGSEVLHIGHKPEITYSCCCAQKTKERLKEEER